MIYNVLAVVKGDIKLAHPVNQYLIAKSVHIGFSRSVNKSLPNPLSMQSFDRNNGHDDFSMLTLNIKQIMNLIMSLNKL